MNHKRGIPRSLIIGIIAGFIVLWGTPSFGECRFCFSTTSSIDSFFPKTGDVRFFVHDVGKTESDHLAYTFLTFSDPHIGGVNDCWDYNLPGYKPDLDLDEGNTGGPGGSYPGEHLDKAIALINDYYDDYYGEGVEQGEAVFCIALGDLSITAERSELQHARMKMNNLHMPWVSVIGNHDTWPYIYADLCWTSDWYYEKVFGHPNTSQGSRSDIFPNWTKQSVNRDSTIAPATRPQSWAFDMGPNHHVGLDFVTRGWYFDPFSYFGNLNTGSWDWYKTHRQNKTSFHERIIVAAHHPLDPLQFGVCEADEIVNFFHDHDPSPINYWFSGHEHPKPDAYWQAGNDIGQYQFEVHCCGSTDSDPPYYVGLVHVYSDYVCDFTLPTTPDPLTTNTPLTFTSTSHFYSGSPINKYYWNFGDGVTYNTTSSTFSHMYAKKGEYWIKHWVENTEGTRSYMIRRILVGDSLRRPKLWVDVKPSYAAAGLMSYLTEPGNGGVGDYVAYLHWHFNPGGAHYTWDDFQYYDGGRIYPNVNPFFYETRKIEYGVADLWMDPEYLYEHETYKWQIFAHLKANAHYPDTVVPSNVYTATPGGDPPGCPQVATYLREDTIEGIPIHVFLGDNTILPHSEHYPEIRTDLLKLTALNAHAGHYHLNIRENDDETSYLDQAKLWALDHLEGTEVATSSDGNIYVYSEMTDFLSCQDNGGIDRSDEVAYQDDSAYLGASSSYLTVTFPNKGWSKKGLLVGMGIPPGGAVPQPPPKNALSIPKKGDGHGGWIPVGEAFTRKNPSLWLSDVSDVEDNTFRIDCLGDSVYINYVGLVQLEDSGWSKQEAQLDSVLKWYQINPPGSWLSENTIQNVYLQDSVFVVIEPSMQLALRFDTLPSDTMLRDFVLETHGCYMRRTQGGGGQASDGKFTPFGLAVRQIKPLSNTAEICFSVPYKTNVRIEVYDIQGRLVTKLVDNEVQSGYHELNWKGRDSAGRRISSGVYFVTMTASEYKASRKIVVLR